MRPTVDVCEGTGDEVRSLSSMQWLLFTLQVPITLQRVSFFCGHQNLHMPWLKFKFLGLILTISIQWFESISRNLH